MKFYLNVFRFDASRDYNDHFEKLEGEFSKDLNLSNCLEFIAKNLRDFSYDEKYFGFRINNKVIFNDIKLSEIYSEFGENLEFMPISVKYAKKDLIIDKDAVFAKYKRKLDDFKFLSSESQEEFRKYILINLISPLDDEDYIGDGFCLYIKWMMVHYKENAKDLLMSISNFENGVMNSVSVKNMIFPPDNSIDKEIEGLKRMLLQSIRCPIRRNHWVKIAKKVEAQFKNQKRKTL